MLQANEEALKGYRPGFWEQICSYQQRERSTTVEKIEFTRARDGNSVMTVTREGTERRFNSAFSPAREAERWAAQYTLDHLENIIVMYGFGNGVFTRSMQNKLGLRDTFLLYEPSPEIFEAVLEEEDVSDILLDPRITLVVGEINPADLYFMLEKYLDWRTVGALCVCAHPEYQKTFPEEYVNVQKQIRECAYLADVVKNTDVHFAHKSVRNILCNMRHIAASNILPDFYQRFPEEYPAIIVAAGPSLDKNIEQLRRAYHKAFLLVVDSAINRMLSEEIPFDATISVDANKGLRHYGQDGSHCAPLFCLFLSRSEILSAHTGKKIWITGARYMQELYDDMGRPFEEINIGGSVATAAFSVCQKLGFRRIILVGQDLAYSEDNTTHAGGTVKSIVGEKYGQEMVEGVWGQPVRSRYDWIIYRNWYESAISQLPDVDVIDATEGGALIHGSRVMTLAQAIDEYCQTEFAMDELLSQAPPTFTGEEYERVREELRHMERELQDIRREAGEGVILCDEALNLLGQCGNQVSLQKQAKQLGRINRTIGERRVYQLLDYYVMDTAVEDLKNINQMTGNREQDIGDTYRDARAMYQSLVDAAEDLKELVHESLEQV